MSDYRRCIFSIGLIVLAISMWSGCGSGRGAGSNASSSGGRQQRYRQRRHRRRRHHRRRHHTYTHDFHTCNTASSVKNIVIMLQENRSFDHYFGHLNEYRTAHGLPADVDDLSNAGDVSSDSQLERLRQHSRSTTC